MWEDEIIDDQAIKVWMKIIVTFLNFLSILFEILRV